MLEVRWLAESCTYWLLNKGDTHFWFGNWLGSGAFCNRMFLVSDQADHRIIEFVRDGK